MSRVKKARVVALWSRGSLNRRRVDLTHRQLGVHPAGRGARTKPLRGGSQVKARTTLPLCRVCGLHQNLDHFIDAVEATRNGEGHLALLERLSLYLELLGDIRERHQVGTDLAQDCALRQRLDQSPRRFKDRALGLIPFKFQFYTQKTGVTGAHERIFKTRLEDRVRERKRIVLSVGALPSSFF